MADESAAPPHVPGQQLWSGMRLPAWLRLLAQHRFAVDRCYWPVVLRNSAISFLSTLLGFVQDCHFRGQVARTPIREPPLFVLGFFRSGTTMLHNLLSVDPRHTFPNTYECFLTNHFLLTEEYVTRRYPLQSTRAMDDVPMTWSEPQEDEFALCMRGQPTFMSIVAFPNDPPQDLEYLDLEALPRRARAAWKRDLLWFLKAVTFKRPGRLVIKSPAHSARIKVLLEIFPDARFVHIVRNPYHVFTSTAHMMEAMCATFGLQRPALPGHKEFILGTYERLLRKLEEGRALVPPGRFHELRYEDLVREPVSQLRTMYEALHLDRFADFQPRLEAYVNDHAGYHAGHHPLAPELHDEIAKRWGEFIRRYGYE